MAEVPDNEKEKTKKDRKGKKSKKEEKEKERRTTWAPAFTSISWLNMTSLLTVLPLYVFLAPNLWAKQKPFFFSWIALVKYFVTLTGKALNTLEFINFILCVQKGI